MRKINIVLVVSLSALISIEFGASSSFAQNNEIYNYPINYSFTAPEPHDIPSHHSFASLNPHDIPSHHSII
ncbi:hypothetical protein [Shouchella miscanthi]|uniref:Uncharacterized protein n=1 Tax=Shouchella miscanthi TaxID=2598861 RepID=A0ABU6NI25_9BACI|nr:hypothetical protein [Shouchella miscanthi]